MTLEFFCLVRILFISIKNVVRFCFGVYIFITYAGFGYLNWPFSVTICLLDDPWHVLTCHCDIVTLGNRSLPNWIN